MNSIAKVASLVGLLATLVPCVLFFLGTLEFDSMKWVVLAGTIVWFVATPLWMGRDASSSEAC